MAMRISDLDTRANFTKNDWFEVEGYNDRTSGKVSGAQIANLCKSLNNGGFYGRETKSLDEFTYADAGVYYWEGTPAISGMPAAGILEIICSAAVDDTLSANETPTFIQRLTNGDEVFTRTVSGASRSSWGVLKNKNGNTILSGISSDGSVNFNEITGRSSSNPFFSQAPVVTVTPINNDVSNYVYIANVQTINTSSFSVARFKSAIQEVVQNTTESTIETTETKENGSNNSDPVSKVVTNHTDHTVTTQTTRGAWETADFAYYWVATVDG